MMASERMDDAEVFEEIAAKYTQLLCGPKEPDRNKILQVLDDINTLNYHYISITNPTKAILIINQCVTLIPPDDSALATKCSNLITNLVINQKLILEGRTLTITVSWCLQALKQNQNPTVLLALHSMLSNCNTNSNNDESNSLSKAVDCILANQSPIVLLANENKLDESVFLALQCLVICTTTKLASCQFEQISRIFSSKLLKHQDNNNDELLQAKIFGVSLKGLQQIVEQYDNYDLGMFLGIAKSYMVFGLRGMGFCMPQKIVPTVLNLPENKINSPREKKGGRIAKQRKHRSDKMKEIKTSDGYQDFAKGYVPANTELLDVSTDSTTLKASDSDFSDSERGIKAKTHVIEGRVRQAALALLFSIIKRTDKNTIFSYWSTLIPCTPASGTQYITTCILRDSSLRSRMAALDVLLSLLTSTKLYLSQAENSVKATSFTSLSVVLGLTLKELHRYLCLALLKNNSFVVLTQILKCFAALVQATPYHKLETGLITKVIKNVKGFIYHRTATVQVAALIVLGCVLASEPCVLETKEALLKHDIITRPPYDDDNDEHIPLKSDYHSDMSWLLNRCLANLTTPTTPAPVKLESLQILSVMSRNYFSTIMANYIVVIGKAVEIALKDKYSELRLHAGRAIDFLGTAMDKYFIGNEQAVDWGVKFWMLLLNGPLIDLLLDEQNVALRAVGCDCLGSIGVRVFERLPEEKQILCVTLLFGCTRDETTTVRGAAVRALAISVLYPSLREDAGYVIDTVEAICRTIQEENLTVRTKASWALGNLTDALVLNPNNYELLDASFILKLFQVAISCSIDNDRTKTDGVRALANLLQLVDDKLLEDERFKETTAIACTALIDNANSVSNVKVRWNACRGLASTLLLIDLVVRYKNFKVRINAALALSAPQTRQHYGEHFIITWNALLEALETSQNMEDFTEYKHRDHLIEQICLGVAHLSLLLTEDDLLHLRDSIGQRFESLKFHMHRVAERIVPEKASIFYEASVFLKSKLTVDEWCTHKDTLNLLIEVFV